MENSQKPIYPVTSKKINETEFFEYNLPNSERQYSGLTKREYFAGLAMQGLLSNPNIERPIGDNEKEHLNFAEVCLKYADALIKELDQ